MHAILIVKFIEVKKQKLTLKLSLNCYLQNLTNQIKWKLLHIINVNYLGGRQN